MRLFPILPVGAYDSYSHIFFISPFSAPVPSSAPTVDVFCLDYDFGGTIDPNEPTIIELARENPDLSLIVALLEATGLDEIFRCPGAYEYVVV